MNLFYYLISKGTNCNAHSKMVVIQTLTTTIATFLKVQYETGIAVQ